MEGSSGVLVLWLLVSLALAEPLVLDVGADGVAIAGVRVVPDLQAGCRPAGAQLAERGATSLVVDLHPDATGAAADCAVRAAEAAGFTEVTLRSGPRSVPVAVRCPADAAPYAWALDADHTVVDRETSAVDLRFPVVRFDLDHPESVALARSVRSREPRVAHLRVSASASGPMIVAAAGVASLSDRVRPGPASAGPAILVDRALWGGGDVLLHVTGGAWLRFPPEALQSERWCVGDVCSWELVTPLHRYALGPATGNPPFGLPTPTRQTEVARPVGTAAPPSGPAPGGSSDLSVCWAGVSASTETAVAARRIAADPTTGLRACAERVRQPVPGAIRLFAVVDRGGRVLDLSLRGTPGPATLDACALAVVRHAKLPPSDDGVTLVPFVWVIPE